MLLKIFRKNSQIFFRKYFVKFSKILLKNVGITHANVLPAQITQYEIKGDYKEERETEFDEYIGNFVYGFCFFIIIIGGRIIG